MSYTITITGNTPEEIVEHLLVVTLRAANEYRKNYRKTEQKCVWFDSPYVQSKPYFYKLDKLNTRYAHEILTLLKISMFKPMLHQLD